MISVGDFLKLLVSMARVPIPTRVDPGLLRPSDVTLQVPDTSKFQSATGWKPQFSFQDSVSHMMEHLRAEVNNEAINMMAAP